MDTGLRERAELFLQTEDSFRINAYNIICEMDKLQGPREYVDEMLHSIFFLGWIHSPKYTPEMILGDHLSEMMEKIFPQPFESYTRKLPKRTPFSCVLEMGDPGLRRGEGWKQYCYIGAVTRITGCCGKGGWSPDDIQAR